MLERLPVPVNKTQMIQKAFKGCVENGDAFFYPLEGKSVMNVQGTLRGIAKRMGLEMHYKVKTNEGGEKGLVVWISQEMNLPSTPSQAMTAEI